MLIVMLFSFAIGCFGFLFVKAIVNHVKQQNYKYAIGTFIIALLFWAVGFGTFTYYTIDYMQGETVVVEGYLQNIESTGKSGDHLLTIGNERLIFSGSTQQLQIGQYYVVEYWASSTIVKTVTRKEETP